MTKQLALTPLLIMLDETPREWVLDEETREVGRRGLAEARGVLRRAPRPTDDERAGSSAADRQRRAA
jgi:hypothetical protein